MIDLWNRLAMAFGEANDGYPSSPRTETPPDAVCCSLLLLGDLDILKWFLLGTVRPISGPSTGLGPNPWKAQGWIDEKTVAVDGECAPIGWRPVIRKVPFTNRRF